MSYGTLLTRTAHVRVEPTGRPQPASPLHRFEQTWNGIWVSGRVSLTSLTLTFIPHRLGPQVKPLRWTMRDITSVELTPGRVQRAVGVRTDGHVTWIRTLGAAGLAEALTEQVAKAQRSSRESWSL